MREREHAGPSLGAFRNGERGFSVIQTHTLTTLSGRATHEAGTLVIAFDRAETATARWQGEGSLPLPAATTVASQFVLRCTIARAELLPAAMGEGEAATPTSLLSCTFAESPASLAALEVPTFHLGRGLGVRAVRDQSMWNDAPATLLRRVE